LFENLKPAQARVVAHAVNARASGPAILADAIAPPQPRRTAAPAQRPVSPGPAPQPELREQPPEGGAPLAAPGLPEERRKEPRAHYTGEVVQLDGEAQSVLVGRDISATGMRVEPNANLQPGASLRLAVYGAAREQPFMLRARVIRNEGPNGVAIAFENLAPAVAKRIERLVASLPAVEPLQGGESDALGAVIGQVLEADTHGHETLASDEDAT
jgi:hypothetical protein